MQGQFLIGASTRENARTGSRQQVIHWIRQSIGRAAGNHIQCWALCDPACPSAHQPAMPIHWRPILTLPLLLPAVFKMFPWMPHQVSLMGVCSCQGTVSHHGDFCLEPGTNVDPSAGAERQGVRAHLVRTGNLILTLGCERNCSWQMLNAARPWLEAGNLASDVIRRARPRG